MLAPWIGAAGQAAYYRQYSQLRQADTAEYEDLLGEISIPVRILWGRHDQILPTQYAEWIAARLPDAPLSWEETAGHLLAEDVPARLLAEILAPPQVRLSTTHRASDRPPPATRRRRPDSPGTYFRFGPTAA